jgi:hypothetical protein
MTFQKPVSVTQMSLYTNIAYVGTGECMCQKQLTVFPVAYKQNLISAVVSEYFYTPHVIPSW